LVLGLIIVSSVLSIAIRQIRHLSDRRVDSRPEPRRVPRRPDTLGGRFILTPN
jgi:hypothetical protein